MASARRRRCYLRRRCPCPPMVPGPSRRTVRLDRQVPPVNPTAITFGSFRLDARAGRLMRGSDPVALRPKTWSVLQYLAERPGVLVTKNELLDAVWGDVAVTEDR